MTAVSSSPIAVGSTGSPGTWVSGPGPGVGVRESMDEVVEQADRLEAAGLTLETEGDVVCCYARQSKHWVSGPDGQRWENYVVLADAHPELEGRTSVESVEAATGGCCDTGATGAGRDAETASACC